jgi:hypothetical protein
MEQTGAIIMRQHLFHSERFLMMANGPAYPEACKEKARVPVLEK